MGFLSRLFGKKAQGDQSGGGTWRFAEAKEEQGDLVAANEVGWEDLREMSVYRIVAPRGQKIEEGEALAASGTLTCPVCQKDSPVDFKVGMEGFFDAPSKHLSRCPHCSSTTRIVGLSTEVEKGKEKYWLLVHRETGPAGAIGGVPRLRVEKLSVTAQG